MSADNVLATARHAIPGLYGEEGEIPRAPERRFVEITNFDGFPHGCEHTQREPHTCPFAVDVHNDSTSKCTCCDACEDNCVQEI